MADSKLTIEVTKMPEVIFQLRVQMAKILREAAESEPEIVKRFANQVADAFEIGSEEVM